MLTDSRKQRISLMHQEYFRYRTPIVTKVIAELAKLQSTYLDELADQPDYQEYVRAAFQEDPFVSDLLSIGEYTDKHKRFVSLSRQLDGLMYEDPEKRPPSLIPLILEFNALCEELYLMDSIIRTK